MLKIDRRAALAASLAGVLAPAAWAQEIVRFVVPFPAGGALDVVGRILADSMREQLAANLVVENRPGVNGNLGAAFVAKAEPDGNTLLVTQDGVVTVNPALFKGNAINPNELVAIGPIAYQPSVLVVSATSPWRTLDEFVRHARGAEVTYSSPGIGSIAHLIMAYFAGQAGLKALHVPYAVGPRAIAAIMSGEVDCSFLAFGNAISQIKSGKVRALGVSSLKRMPQVPEAPTIAEQNFPGFELNQSYLLMGPARLPRPRRERIAGALFKALESPDVVKRLRDLGMEPAARISDEQLQANLTDMGRRWTTVIQRHNITAN